MNEFFYTKLQNRGLIHIEGADRHDFLQGLITNDIKKCAPGALLYACLLNAQGKFLHDFFVHEGDGFLLLDCEGGARAQDLFKRLNMYRLRKDVQLSVEESVPVYAILDDKIKGLQDKGNISSSPHPLIPSSLPDPRHPDMGWRSFDKPDLPEQPFEAWDSHRIKLCIPDGSRDLISQKSTMDEARMDTLNAVDYNKGCYVGQELTARMHYRGLGKKHLYAVQGSDLPTPGEDIVVDGKTIGEMRSRCGDLGLALLRDEHKDRAPLL